MPQKYTLASWSAWNLLHLTHRRTRQQSRRNS
jgi:hypothetical protein